MAVDSFFFQGCDMLGRGIILPKIPSRIVTLVPSQTELICELGLKQNLVGITRFCTHPETLLKEKFIVGGTKNVNVQKVLALNPELVIANKEENLQETVDELQKSVPVWVSDVRTVEQAFQMIEGISQILGVNNKGVELINLIKNRNATIIKPKPTVRVAYFIWQKPWMIAGKDTFIDAMMQLAGLENIATQEMGRYPELSADEILKLQPQLLLFSSEPYPFNQDKINEYMEFKYCNNVVVDGRLFSWYGNSMLDFPEYVNKEILIRLNT